MSGTRRQRDSIAPSLFPFLAVLLCTMGALVVILMLVVSGAQASAQHVADDARERREEVESLVQLANSSYRRRLGEGQIALEKQRLMLQHFEEHIAELLAELEQLEQTFQTLNDDSASDEHQLEKQRQAISELEKQLAAAAEELKQKLDKPDGDKPIFAVIPYAGSAGTHRRPIYLECVEEGVVIQPEGVMLSLDDLSPPHGPGNPLDAALRTIRAEYKPANGAVTRTAYPLLIVRPSGIRTYSLARSAMSGWDDQFGYELIDEDLELAFPSGVPGLDNRIVNAIRLARDRQAALVMAMPGKYGQPGNGNYALGSDAGRSSGTRGDSIFDRAGPTTRGGYAGGGGDQGKPSGSGFGDRGRSMLGYDGNEVQELTNGPSGGSSGNDDDPLFTDVPGSTDPFGATAAAVGGQAASSGENGATADEGTDSEVSPNQTHGTSSRRSSASRGETNGSMQSAAGARQSATGSQGAARAGGSRPPSGKEMNADPSQQAMPQLSLTADFSNHRDESSRPVAQNRGRNWAWSRGPRTQTPVVRSIHLHCFSDRWVLLPEDGNLKKAIEIPFEGTPQQRAEKLAGAVLDRVDDWGLALAGGYWKPVIVVDVAPQTAWRFDQLVQLLDGSGLEIRRRRSTPQ